MGVGLLSVVGSVNGTPFGSANIGNLVVSSNAVNGGVTEVVLANGDNTITVPTLPTTTAALIIFNSASTTTKKLKGAGADTGITVTKTGFCLLSWDTSAIPASFIINSSAADTGNVTNIYFL